jgi:hypothetical protein
VNSIQITMGRFARQSTTISPKCVSRSPSQMNRRYIGTSTPTAGIILVDSIHSSRSLVRLVGANAMPHAAGMAISSASKVEPPAMMMEFIAKRG